MAFLGCTLQLQSVHLCKGTEVVKCVSQPCLGAADENARGWFCPSLIKLSTIDCVLNRRGANSSVYSLWI